SGDSASGRARYLVSPATRHHRRDREGPQIVAVELLTDRPPSGGGRRAGIRQTPLRRSEFGSRLRGIAIVPPRPSEFAAPIRIGLKCGSVNDRGPARSPREESPQARSQKPTS